MKRLVNNICLIVCTLMLPLLCCGCFKDEEIVNKLYEGKAHDGELRFYITFEINGVQYESTLFYRLKQSSSTNDMFYNNDYYPLFNDTRFVFASYYSDDVPFVYGTYKQGVFVNLYALSRINTEKKWEPNRKYSFNTDVLISCGNFIFFTDRKTRSIKRQLPYGWISFRPLNDEYAFEALFEFDIETEDGEIIEFRNGKQVSYYRGPDAVRNGEIFTSDL